MLYLLYLLADLYCWLLPFLIRILKILILLFLIKILTLLFLEQFLRPYLAFILIIDRSWGR